MPGQDGVHGGIGCKAVADIKCCDLGLPASGFDVRAAQRQGSGIAAIENHQRTGLGQTLRHRKTQAARGTGDERHPALQRENLCHGKPPG